MPRNLALNISVGALEDNSVGKTFRSVTASTSELGKQHRALNRELQKVSAVQKYTEQLGRLKAQTDASGKASESLTRRIRMKEEQLSAATADVKRMGYSLDNLGQAETRLRKKIERTNTTLKNRQRLGKAMGSLKTGASFTMRQLGPGGLLGSTAIGSGIAAITYSNRLAAEQANLAAAVGLSAKEMSAWSSIVEQAGFDADHVNALVEELNNKFGEGKGLGELPTEAADALKILNLEFAQLRKLKPDKQFAAIIKAAQKMGGQEALSAVDMLLGGDANLIVGYINSRDMPVEQLIKRFDRLYVGSQEGIEGAKSFSIAWSELSFTLGKAFQEVTGLIGTELAPQMRQWAEELADTFRTNREEIDTFAKGLGTTLKNLGKGLATLATNLPTIVSAMTTLSNLVLKWFGEEEKEPGTPHEGIARREQARRNFDEAKILNRAPTLMDRGNFRRLMASRAAPAPEPESPQQQESPPALLELPSLKPVMVDFRSPPESQETPDTLRPFPLQPVRDSQQPQSPQTLLDSTSTKALIETFHSPAEEVSLPGTNRRETSLTAEGEATPPIMLDRGRLRRLTASRQTPVQNRITQDNRMTVTMNITQQPGESGESLAEKIKGNLIQLGRQVADQARPTTLHSDAGGAP